MKKSLLFKSLLLGSLLLPATQASAADETLVQIGDLWYMLTTLGKKHYAAVMPDGNYMYDLQGEVTVPQTVEYDDIEWTVNELYSQAFCYQEGVTKINLPETITIVGELSFLDCASLTEVNLPQTVERIDQGVFYGCKSLPTVTLPLNMKQIPYSFFRNCESLTTIGIPQGVKEIAQCSFDGCKSLASITIPEGVTLIDGLAFRDCEKLTSFKIPASCDSIGTAAFGGCYGLAAFEVADGNTRYSASDGILYSHSTTLAAYPQGKKDSSLTIPDQVTAIGEGAFYGDRTLSLVTLPASAVELQRYSFAFCEKLKEIKLNDGLLVVGSHAFYTCPLLAKADLPATLKRVDDNAFFNNTKLAEVNFPSTLESIGKIAYYGCTSVKSFDIPEGITEILINTFAKCTALTSVTLPSTLETIGEFAFNDDKSLSCVKVNAVTPPEFTTRNAFPSAIFPTCRLLVPDESIDDYKSANIWQDFADIQTAGVDAVSADSSLDVPLYFDLRGIPVEKPEHGIFIRRQGGKTSKVAIP